MSWLCLVRIQLCVMEELSEVHSHPMAIHQCRKFFRKYPNIKLVEAEDTALSAKNIADNNLVGIGAIAGDLPAEIYGLEILAHEIESIKNNQTRFFMLKRKSDIYPNGGYTKASIFFNTSHESGSLSGILARIADEKINLSKIHSYPIPGENWEYFFHLDLEFKNPKQFKTALDSIKSDCTGLQVLGTYHRGLEIK